MLRTHPAREVSEVTEILQFADGCPLALTAVGAGSASDGEPFFERASVGHVVSKVQVVDR